MKKLEDMLLRNLDDQTAVFVFPTDVAAKQWAERILAVQTEGTVAMERFIAWDSFKGDSIKSNVPGKRSVPSVVRRLFVETLITRNARLAAAPGGAGTALGGHAVAPSESAIALSGEPSLPFKSLVSPAYADDASGFAPWLAGLLPQLAYWKNVRCPGGTLPPDADAEDHDLFALHKEYQAFLDANNLFDPAWETPPFKGKQHERYLIFYPEALADFAEYEALLKSTPSVELVTKETLDDEPGGVSDDSAPAEPPDTPNAGTARAAAPADKSGTGAAVKLYSNSRTELRHLALRLRRDHYEDGIPWDQLAVHVPDTETLGPYLTRELALYDIPHQYRVGKPLASRGAGLLFNQASECVNRQFSFETVKDLLLNDSLPWNEPEVITQLIDFGKRNCCICPFTQNGKTIDVWELSFAEHPEETRAHSLYRELVSSVTALVRAHGFAAIKKQYFSFKRTFFRADGFTTDNDHILSRCIAELETLIDMERSFPSLAAPNAFTFFVQVLKEKIYVPQAQKNGVHVYEYKLAAAAPFERHYLVDASQKSLEVSFGKLLFLRKDKREAMELFDTDATPTYIRMYGQNSPAGCTCFTVAEKSFSGFAIPHSCFAEVLPGAEDALDAGDPFKNEAAYFADKATTLSAPLLSAQTGGFREWAGQSAGRGQGGETARGRTGTALGAGAAYPSPYISKTALEEYLACPRIWHYKRALKLEETDLTASLMQDTWTGTILHSVLERFFRRFGKDEAISGWETDPKHYAARLDAAIEATVSESQRDRRTCALTRELTRDQLHEDRKILERFLRSMLPCFAGYTVLGTELRYTATREPENLSGNAEPAPYTLMGYIDLALLSPTMDAITLVDYKTGDGPSIKDCYLNDEGALNNTQFAIYTYLFEQNTPTLKVGSAQFLSITKPGKRTVIFSPESGSGGGKTPKHSREDFEPSIDTALEYADFFAGQVQRGTLEPYGEVGFTTCRQCAYKAICRTAYNPFAAPRPVPAAYKETEAHD